MERIIFKNAVVWIGSMQEITADLKQLCRKYARLSDLLQNVSHH